MFLGDLSLTFKTDHFNIASRLDSHIKRFQLEIEFNLMGLKRRHGNEKVKKNPEGNIDLRSQKEIGHLSEYRAVKDHVISAYTCDSIT